MANELTHDAVFSQVINATAAGTSVLTGTVLDMQGFESVVLIASLGALTSTQVTSLEAYAGNVSTGSDSASIAGSHVTAADADSNKLLILEIDRIPGFRYITPVLSRGTANAVVDCVIAIQYRTRKKPTTQGTTVSGLNYLCEPALGAA